MRDIRDADSAENVEDQRSRYRQVSTLLAQYMPGVPLMNVTSNVALSRDVRGYVTEQNAIEYFTKITVPRGGSSVPTSRLARELYHYFMVLAGSR